MAISAAHLRVAHKFVAKRTGGGTGSPSLEHHTAPYAHFGCQRGVKVRFELVLRLVAGSTVRRPRLHPALLRMAGEARRVAYRRRFERAFLEPKGIADIVGRLCEVLLIAVALRVDRLMAHRTAFLLAARGGPRCCNKSAFGPLPSGHHRQVNI